VNWYHPVWVVPMPGYPGYFGDTPYPRPYIGDVPYPQPQQWPYHWYVPQTTKIVVTNGTQSSTGS
jgi:hypothetical protein